MRAKKTASNHSLVPGSLRILSVALILGCNGTLSLSLAQIQTSIMPDATLPNGNNSSTMRSGPRVDITGGHAAGSNLFHSFSDFQLGNGETANFLSQGANNILSRVTGSNPSNIFGTVSVDIGQANRTNANLFFLNPNGVVFGPNASLDLSGSFHVSTAASLRLGTEPGTGLFSASDPTSDLITSAPPSAFGFSASNPMGISVEGATLRMQSGKVISIIGGDSGGLLTDESPGVRISNSTIDAPGGQINLISMAGPGTVTTTGPDFTSVVSLTDATELGSLEITNGSRIDVTENGGGTIAIRGGRLTLNNRSRITAKTQGADKAGTIRATAQRVDLIDGGQFSTSSEGTGAAGTILVTATNGEVNLSGNDRQTTNGTNAETAFVSGLFANTEAQGDAGKITIQTQDLNITGGAVIEGNTTGRGSGDAGDITILANGDVMLSGRTQTVLSGQTLITPSTISSNVNDPTTISEGLLGSGGTITINARNLTVNDGAKLSAKSLGDSTISPAPQFLSGTTLPSAGTVNISLSDSLTISDVFFEGANVAARSEITVGATGPASVGAIQVAANNINIQNGGLISAETESLTRTEARGNISLMARDTITVSGFETQNPGISNGQPLRRSQIAARTSGVNDAGNITLTAKNLIVSNGADIVSATLTSGEGAVETAGAGGNVTINVAETVSISGRANGREFADQSAISSVSRTNGTAGNIAITANNVTLANGGIITASSQPDDISKSGQGGTVTIRANDTLTVSGVNTEINGRPLESRISSGTTGNKNAGELSLSADNITVTNGGSIAATTSGAGDGGLIRLNADKTFLARGKTIVSAQDRQTTITSGSEGRGDSGTINIAAEKITIQDGAKVRTSATGSGTAGNIDLVNAKEIRLDGGTLETTAAENSGGDIKLTASDLILVKESQITTSVQGDVLNQGGNINIDPEFIVLINSQMEANAATGSGGNMNLFANVIFTDFRTTFMATGGPAGIDGTVNIQAPIQNLSQAIAPLPESLVEVAALYNAQCAGQKNGKFNSFSLKGRDRIPYVPGELIPTPLSLSNLTRARIQNPQTLSSPITQARLSPFKAGFATALQMFQYQERCSS